jgi:K+-transporting ATPase KdpF subunit
MGELFEDGKIGVQIGDQDAGHSFYWNDRRVLPACNGISCRLRQFEERRDRRMNWEAILSAICSVLLLAYLVYALLKPEKF